MSLPFSSRPKGDVLCLFDVDGTLSLARQVSNNLIQMIIETKQ